MREKERQRHLAALLMESSGPFQIWGLTAALACFPGAQNIRPLMRLVCQPQLIASYQLLHVYPLHHPEPCSLICLASISRACRPIWILPAHLFLHPYAFALRGTLHLPPDPSSTHWQLPVAWKLSGWHPSPSLFWGMVDSYSRIMSGFLGVSLLFFGVGRDIPHSLVGSWCKEEEHCPTPQRDLSLSPHSASYYSFGESVVEIESGLVLLESSSQQALREVTATVLGSYLYRTSLIP